MRGRPSSRPYTACTYNPMHCKNRQYLIAHTLHVRTIQRIVKPGNASPRSCRGEWKLARNTRNTYTKRQRIHARQKRGRPSSRPYTACMYNATHCKTSQCLTAPTLHVRTIQCIAKHRQCLTARTLHVRTIQCIAKHWQCLIA